MAAGQGDASMTSRWYGASDSEREQPGWRVPESTSRAAERALLKQSAAEAEKALAELDTAELDAGEDSRAIGRKENLDPVGETTAKACDNTWSQHTVTRCDRTHAKATA